MAEVAAMCALGNAATAITVGVAAMAYGDYGGAILCASVGLAFVGLSVWLWRGRGR